MQSIYEKSEELQQAVLSRLHAEPVHTNDVVIPLNGFFIVCPEFQPGAEQLDTGEAWHDLAATQQRACQITFAALELQDYLLQITGCLIPIRVEEKDCSSVILLVADEQAEDGFKVECPTPDTVVLHGNNPRSLLYAVYHILEVQGCRWYGLGSEEQVLPRREGFVIPPAAEQNASFPLRFFHSHLENRASAAMLDWFGKNKLNFWGADNDRPGQRSRGIQTYGGNHWLQPRSGMGGNFDFSDELERTRFIDSVLELYTTGCYRDVDYLDYIGDDWGKRADSPGMNKLGNAAAQDIFLLTEVQKAFDAAFREGRISRRVGTWGWAYYDTVTPPDDDLPEGFAANVGLWAMSDPRFCLDDPAAHHNFAWPHLVTEERVEITHLPTNREIWASLKTWPCCTGFGDYHAMARNHFLPAPFVSLLADTIPKLKAENSLYYSYMHLANGYWGLMQPFNYLMTRLLWDSETDVPATLAEMLRHQFGTEAALATMCLFAVERAMLGTFWLRSHVAKRLAVVTLHGLNEPFWTWGEHYPREEILKSLQDLEKAREILDGMQSTPRVELWREQVEYAHAMQQLYFHAIETYEAARKAGSWHFCKGAAVHFNEVQNQLRRLAAIDLPRWLRNVHYFPRDILHQTLIGPPLERMSGNLGIAFSAEVIAAPNFISDPAALRAEVLWTHGAEIPLEVGKGNYAWAQPYVCGHRIFVTGQDKEATPYRSVLRCLNLNDGAMLWERVTEDKDHNAALSTYIGIEDDGGTAKSLLVREAHENPRRPSALFRLDALTGRELWRIEDPPHQHVSGNGAALVLDIDNDGRLEVIDSAVTHVALIDLETGQTRWRYADRVSICHGVSAVADLDGDGRLEIVFGSEYNESKSTSTLVALRDDGSVFWKSSGHLHDLGSTRAHLLDIDGDGKLEILHAGLDLLGQNQSRKNELYCWNFDGSLRYRVPLGGREVSLADFDGDGEIEAIAITSGRDGGFAVRPAIVCLDAATGASKWSIAIPRHYLDDDLRVVADFDGDSLPEALLFTSHQNGYGHVAGQPAWGDAYLVKGNGRIVWQAQTHDMAYATLVGGTQCPREIVIASGNGYLQRLCFHQPL